MIAKRFTIFLTLLLLSAAFTGCGKGDEPVDSGAAADASAAVQEPAASVEDGTGGGTAVANPSTNDESPSETASEPAAAVEQPAPSPSDTLYADPDEALDSYRMTTDIQLLSDGVITSTQDTTHVEMEWVRNPPAKHTAIGGMVEGQTIETIVIGSQTWINMGGDNWVETPSSAATPQNPAADLEGMLQEIQNSMEPLGTETVNGVNCQKYAVDADFVSPLPITVDDADVAQALPTEFAGHIAGTLWIADESGLPPVIIRSDTTQNITMRYESRPDQSMRVGVKRDLYDINAPIVIEPPQGATVMPVAPPIATTTAGDATTADNAAGNASNVAVASLDTLDSYRLEWTAVTKASGTEITLSNRVEWVRDPFAVHVYTYMGADYASPVGEYLIIGDKAWYNLDGSWIDSAVDEAENSYTDIMDTLQVEEDATLINEEDVDGVNCYHFAYDQVGLHKEWWVAHQADLPPVVVKVISQLSAGGMTGGMNGRVYDINVPITIAPPQ